MINIITKSSMKVQGLYFSTVFLLNFPHNLPMTMIATFSCGTTLWSLDPTEVRSSFSPAVVSVRNRLFPIYVSTLRTPESLRHDHGFFFMCKHHLDAGVGFIPHQRGLDIHNKRSLPHGLHFPESFSGFCHFQYGHKAIPRIAVVSVGYCSLLQFIDGIKWM